MKYLRAMLFAVLEAFVVGLGSFVLIGFPALFIALFSITASFDLKFVIVITSAIWLWGHALPLEFEVSAGQAMALGAGESAITFPVSLPLLGIMAITVIGALRAGYRAAAQASGRLSQLVAVCGGAVCGFAIVAVVVAGFGQPLGAAPVSWLVVKPVLFFSGSFLAGVLLGERSRLARLFESRILPLVDSEKWVFWVSPLRFAPRICAALAAVFVTIAGVGFGLALALHATDFLRLSQSLHLDWLGVLAFWMLHALFLPTVLLWTLAWFSGAGFMIDTATAFSPFMSDRATLPALPLFGVIPDSWGELGFLAPLTFVAGAVLIGVLADKHLKNLHSLQKLCVVGAVGFVLFLVFVWSFSLATGAIGPAKFTLTGPNPWQASSLLTAQALLGLGCGFFVPDAVRRGIEWGKTGFGSDFTELGGVRSTRGVSGVRGERELAGYRDTGDFVYEYDDNILAEGLESGYLYEDESSVEAGTAKEAESFAAAEQLGGKSFTESAQRKGSPLTRAGALKTAVPRAEPSHLKKQADEL
ncbi:hypothetical protein KJY77_04775 [Canibacter sp. lx-72]|uniref:cell division protein PerM n=1 Tax=Canibacter zhuwentaonis TaxID=2837491 RepID=UPI001BDCABE1|nr:DUF6350 family protein [Canibacter zhuwentaonis]MBT1018451.1 hypothetical protein [Canibacter zhuwentaonis]